MGRHRYELKDSEWERIAEMLPKEHPKEGKRGRPTKYDNRSVINGNCGLPEAAHLGENFPNDMANGRLFTHAFKSCLKRESRKTYSKT